MITAFQNWRRYINVRKKQKQPETCIVVNDTSQRSVAT